MNTAAEMTVKTPRVLYTARVRTTGGGRDGGTSQSDDRRLDIRHTVPGKPGNGTNPEQLFAAGWSACFEGALGLVAHQMKVALPADMAIDAEVDLLLGADGYAIQGRLNISLPGVPRETAQALADAAEKTCPYSKATRGNMRAVITVV